MMTSILIPIKNEIEKSQSFFLTDQVWNKMYVKLILNLRLKLEEFSYRLASRIFF